MTKNKPAPKPTVRNVRAALRAADIRVYERPRQMRTHDGQLVQSTGCYGSKVEKWSDTEVRVSYDFSVSSAASPEMRTAARERAVVLHVTALGQFTVQFNTTFHCLIVSAA